MGRKVNRPPASVNGGSVGPDATVLQRERGDLDGARLIDGEGVADAVVSAGGGGAVPAVDDDRFLPGGSGGGIARPDDGFTGGGGGRVRLAWDAGALGGARAGLAGGGGGGTARGGAGGTARGGVGGTGRCGELLDRFLPGTGGTNEGFGAVGGVAGAEGPPDGGGGGGGGGGAGGAPDADAAATGGGGARPGIGGGALNDLGSVWLIDDGLSRTGGLTEGGAGGEGAGEFHNKV